MNAIPKRYQSLSGRFTYGFKDTYFWDLNFGLNGSENFEPGKQYGSFRQELSHGYHLHMNLCVKM